ncbi:dipeptide epimerase [Marinifilum caeruleilacunae]|uniref:Dipeptide epimerase n=1 Tax=Marinifilum caeruleilacunae TaxID=2499076 RepID=A0ABX1X086_9BACT|nr:dipeptide epimerase [Marinifilum caeruleilacunae]NOU61833.1 dipeptide epimerase [Marinifilum caeruleilacunae]
MTIDRRKFLGNSGLLAGAACLLPLISGCEGQKGKPESTYTGSGLKLSFEPYDLQLKHVFTIASFSRTTTPVMLVKIEWGGFVGYGEASMPPYLGESHKTAAKFLSSLKLDQFTDPFRLNEILSYVDGVAEGNCAAKASVDIALHDLIGKIVEKPWYQIWGYNQEDTPVTTFTIGIDKPEVVKEKVIEASPYKMLKVKIGRGSDEEMINTIRKVTDIPLCVDVNQGWKDKQEALDKIHWLKEQGVVFVEQPMDKYDLDTMAWLTQHSPLPTIADEGIQRLADVPKLKGAYSGINIKLMKCTGLREAHKMLNVARALDMKVMIGCMTETSCGVSAASQLSPMVDWADLDGNLLISNDPYKGVTVQDGKVLLPSRPGIGIIKL